MIQLCEYGCERIALFPPRKGQRKWCCSEKFTQCPAMITKMNIKKRGRSWDETLGIAEANKKREKLRKNMLENNPMNIMDPWNKGKKDIYSEETLRKMKNNRCSNKGISWNELYGGEKAEILKKEQSKRMTKWNKGRKPWNVNKPGCFNKRTLNLMSEKAKGRMKDRKLRNKISTTLKKGIDYYLETYPFFSNIEKIKEGKNKEILVKCKNCGKYFEPNGTQLYERIRQLEKIDGNDGCYFYCSEECKQQCPLYNLKQNPLKITKKYYTDEEYQTFRKFVLERDNYKCQYCGEKAEHVHHEKPQKLEPFFALDPDFAWSVCKKCHYKYGHKDECSTGKLSNIICGDKNNEKI